MVVAGRLGAFLLGLLLCVGAARAAPADPKLVERIEPPHWWVGMQDGHLELLVHGEGIATWKPTIRHAGVVLEKTFKVANENYLFLSLRIARNCLPGEVKIAFSRQGNVFYKNYTLKARATGSASRKGFSAADVILNIVPDRFSNGDPENDNIPGYPDPANRASNGAGRHGGDIQGMIDHLDYIAAMGYTMIWPTPLTENKQPEYSYHGYAATDTYKIDPRFGTLDDYKRLVATAKSKGIGVIADVVLNHIGSEHWWMKDLPSPDWIGFDGKYVPTDHFRTAVGDPYASAADKKNYTSGWFAPTMPDVNQANPRVAQYQIQNAIWWVEETGLSGLRIDTYGYSNTRFLSAWSGRLMAEYPSLNMVGEEWSANPVVLAYWMRGNRGPEGTVPHLPSLMDFPLNETLRKALVTTEGFHTGLADLYAAMVNDRLYAEPMNMVLFEGNHDMPRLYSVLGNDAALTRMALAYVLTMRGIPQLYYGTEVLMPSPVGRDDGETRRDFPGGWAGDTVSARTGAGLSVEQREMQDWLKRLMNWRKTQPALHRGALMHYTPQNGTYVYFRHLGKDQVMVVINKNPAETSLDLSRFAERLAGHKSATEVLSRQTLELGASLQLPARSVLILEMH